LIVLVVLAGSSAGAYFYFKPSGAAADPKSAKAAKTAETESLDMGDMVVNLAGNGGSHYLRVKITLEYPKEKKLSAELKAKQYQIKDVLITTLRSKSLQEVSSANAIPGLKGALLKEINNNLTSGEVTGIYFTDFLVQ
jgi:flagellar FliL protein